MSTWTCLHPRCNGKRMDHQGVPMHRAGHRNRGELQFQMRKPGFIITYNLRPNSSKDESNGKSST